MHLCSCQSIRCYVFYSIGSVSGPGLHGQMGGSSRPGLARCTLSPPAEDTALPSPAPDSSSGPLTYSVAILKHDWPFSTCGPSNASVRRTACRELVEPPVSVIKCAGHLSVSLYTPSTRCRFSNPPATALTDVPWEQCCPRGAKRVRCRAEACEKGATTGTCLTPKTECVLEDSLTNSSSSSPTSDRNRYV